MTIRVIAIDPGKTTGIVIANCQTPKQFEIELAFDLVWDDRLQWLESSFPLDADHIVIESFNLFKHKAKAQIGSDFPAVQMIGAVEMRVAMAEEYMALGGLPNRSGVDYITYQTPSQRAKAAILPQHKQHFEGLHHAKDAYKHLRVFISNPKNQVFK